VDTRIGDIR
jgi:hypothetical protein